MNVAPIVRYMILCNDWGLDPDNEHRVNIYGLLSNIYPIVFPPYPLIQPEMCVFVSLIEIRGVGITRIMCVFEETGELIFQTSERAINGTADLLEIIGVPFRLSGCIFPRPGIYSIQFWYNEIMVHECPLQLRSSS